MLLAGLAAFVVGTAGLSMFSHAQDAGHEGHDHAAQPEAMAIEPDAMPEADTDTVSYALGFRVGSDFAQREVELNVDQFAAGLAAAVAGEDPRLSEEELMQALFTFQMQMQAKQQEQMQRVAQESEAFLQQNREAEGVQVTDSGLQYKVIEQGEGDSPAASDIVTVHYRGTLVDGQQFDSSYDRNEPLQLPANRVIPGWTEALQMMNRGAKWEIYIPADLAYGQQGQGPIPPNAALIFEVELLDFEAPE